jgi:hypothetical protein
LQHFYTPVRPVYVILFFFFLEDAYNPASVGAVGQHPRISACNAHEWIYIRIKIAERETKMAQIKGFKKTNLYNT